MSSADGAASPPKRLRRARARRSKVNRMTKERVSSQYQAAAAVGARGGATRDVELMEVAVDFVA